MTADLTPFWERRPQRTSPRDFWVPGERIVLDGASYQRGPMFVAWEAPAEPTGRPSVCARSRTCRWQS